MERVSIGGSKVVQGAGKAVKLLGKLLGGGGDRDRDRGAQEALSVPSAARSSSYGSMSLPATASVALPGGWGGWVWLGAATCCAAMHCGVARSSASAHRSAALLSRSTPAAAVRASQYQGYPLPSPAADDDASVGGDRERSEGSVGAIVALLAPPDGSVWVGHASGTVDRYTPAGKRLGTEECGSNLTAAACVGRRVWLGFSDGMLRWLGAGRG